MRRTLADAKASRIPMMLNMSDGSRVTYFVNAAIERLITEGHWWGTIQKWTVSVTDQLFTLPPQFATIEQIAVCQHPIPLRNNWAEFNCNSWGVVNDPTSATPNVCTGDQALFRGNFCLAKDIVSGNKVYAQCDVADDVGTKITIFGVDASSNWVRTKVAGVWQDGETIALAQTPGTLSSTTWSKITDVQKPLTNGQMWLVQASNPTVIIASYAYWETRPMYGRYLLPTTFNVATQIDLIGKMGFVPVVNDTDYLLIGNLQALRLACKAVQLEEEGNLGMATLYMYGGMDPKTKMRITGAVQVLDAELAHYRGAGEVPSIQVVGSNIDGGCSVEALL